MSNETMSTEPSAMRCLARRDEFMASVPKRYRGELHLTAVNLLGGVLVALVARGLDAVRPIELVTVPVAFLFANYFEWRIHRGPLHHRRWPQILHARHTLLHHVAFTAEHMAVRNLRELRMVLFPLPALFGVALIALGPALVIAWLGTANAGRLFYLVGLSYYLLYEWCHLAFHLPPSSWLGRRAIVRRLRRFHTRHHDPRLMQHRNFNVTFPICDFLLGTLDHQRSDIA